ncbi:MAG: PrgI family protein [Candidatus Roizmanbacteria bacterium]|nr:PrgI family protein [Candidatus Roizmanbacteria bacterium]
MDQHPVPRQITTFEFKLIGFMTLRQFLYLVIFFPIGFIVYKIIPIPFVNIVLGVLIGVVGIAFAFIPIQDRPLETWLKNFIKRINSPTQYVFKKQSDKIGSIEELYFTSDPHLALTHIETKKKLNAYIQSTKKDENENSTKAEVHAKKQQGHINDLLQQTKNTNPSEIKKADVQLLRKSAVSQQDTIKQPFVTGVVKNRKQIPLPGTMVSIQDTTGMQIRLLKTNPHGVFATYSPLHSGDYQFEISDPKGNYFFDTMNVHIDSEKQVPLMIYSKETL